MGHVLARVSGFGWTIVPVFPFRLERVEGSGRALRVERGGVTPRMAMVSIEASGPRLNLSPPTSSAADVCELSPSKVLDDFRVETSVFTVGWPAGFNIVSAEPGGPCPFDLNDDGCLLYLQGPLAPARVPKLDAMCAPGQRIADRGVHAVGEWIELAYEHEGRMHWQRHTTLRWSLGSVLIVTAQSPQERATRTRAAAAFVIETLDAWRG